MTSLKYISNNLFTKEKVLDSLEKLSNSRAIEISSLETVQSKIQEGKGNAIVVFHAEWCGHCKEFIPHFEQASQYKITEDFHFIKVNCHNKDICNYFDVKRYPTIKVFYKGKELEDEPGRDVESVLEFISKLSAESLVQLNSHSDIEAFKEKSGDFSFVAIYDRKESDFYLCLQELSESKFKSMFSFAVLQQDKYENTSKRKTPALIYNDKYGIISEWNGSCKDLEQFIERNKYPIITKLDSAYVKRLQKDNKKLIIAAISVKNSSHMYLVDTIMANISVENRNIVFAFIDIDLDAHLVSYFKLNVNDIPKIVVYDFDSRKYYVDNPSNSNNIYSDEKNASNYIKGILSEVAEDNLIWTTGNFFEDFLAKFGIKLTQTAVLYILTGLFALIIIILFIVVFCCGEKNEDEEKKKILEEQIKKSEDSKSEVIPKDIDEKKNQ